MHQAYHISDLLSLIDVPVSLTPHAVTSKSLPRIPVHKTGRPNSFGYESKGSPQPHGEPRTSTIALVYEVVSVNPLGCSNVLSCAVRLSLAIP